MDYGQTVGRGFADAPFVVRAERGGKRELVAKLNATMAVMRPRHHAVPAPAAPAG